MRKKEDRQPFLKREKNLKSVRLYHYHVHCALLFLSPFSLLRKEMRYFIANLVNTHFLYCLCFLRVVKVKRERKARKEKERKERKKGKRKERRKGKREMKYVVHIYILHYIIIINNYVSCTTNRPGFILLKANYKFLKNLQSKTLKCGTFNVT